jgi:hypothetical protein
VVGRPIREHEGFETSKAAAESIQSRIYQLFEKDKNFATAS